MSHQSPRQRVKGQTAKPGRSGAMGRTLRASGGAALTPTAMGIAANQLHAHHPNQSNQRPSIRLPCVHSPAHDMSCPLIRGNRGEDNVETKKMHVKHKLIMVRATCSAVPQETTSHTRHFRVEMLQRHI